MYLEKQSWKKKQKQLYNPKSKFKKKFIKNYVIQKAKAKKCK